MKFQIIWSDSALKELKKLERSVSKRIFAKVSLLENEPYRRVQKLVGSPFFKLRVGDYRIILEIKQEVLHILVIKVGHIVKGTII
ncbi:type II toxin-antitoxin system RelE/ParE family toxin [Candidatus Woesearchaeota archaeon]|nr:type II toxin-antitoxin system RelE/ParE family toxin [Candidatus Woesearchaeota archaeon]